MRPSLGGEGAAELVERERLQAGHGGLDTAGVAAEARDERVAREELDEVGGVGGAGQLVQAQRARREAAEQPRRVEVGERRELDHLRRHIRGEGLWGG